MPAFQETDHHKHRIYVRALGKCLVYFKWAHFRLSGDYIRGWYLGQPRADSQVECLEMALNVHCLPFVLNSSRATDDCIDCANVKVGDIKIVSMAEVCSSMWQESRDGFVVRPAMPTLLYS